jgi:hypothetical protein
VRTRRRTVVAVAGALATAGLLAAVLAGRREQFAGALDTAPLLILLAAAALQVVALVSRSEAWHRCVHEAGATVSRRSLFRAASMGNLGSMLSSQLGAAARIAVLRHSAPGQTPHVPALIAAEVPIIAVEGTLGAIASFTLVGPLGLPWWAPLACLVAAGLVLVGLHAVAGHYPRGLWVGLAVLRSARGRVGVLGFVLVAVFAQIARNWLMLHAVGVHASVLDATAVLIAMVALSQLPVGPSVGAAAVVGVLGSGGVALAAAAGVLLTVTGTAGALGFLGWGLIDRLWVARPAVSPGIARGAFRGMLRRPRLAPHRASP